MYKTKKGLWGLLLVGGLVLLLAAMGSGAWAAPNQDPLRGTVPTPGKIVGVVFTDNNGNGVYDEGVDTPLEDVTVTLDPGPGQTTFPTNADGTYEFTVALGSTHIVEALGVQRSVSEDEQQDFYLGMEPVGGYALSVNKFELLAPWIGLAALMGVLAAAVVVRRRRQE